MDNDRGRSIPVPKPVIKVVLLLSYGSRRGGARARISGASCEMTLRDIDDDLNMVRAVGLVSVCFQKDEISDTRGNLGRSSVFLNSDLVIGPVCEEKCPAICIFLKFTGDINYSSKLGDRNVLL